MVYVRYRELVHVTFVYQLLLDMIKNVSIDCTIVGYTFVYFVIDELSPLKLLDRHDMTEILMSGAIHNNRNSLIQFVL